MRPALWPLYLRSMPALCPLWVRSGPRWAEEVHPELSERGALRVYAWLHLCPHTLGVRCLSAHARRLVCFRPGSASALYPHTLGAHVLLVVVLLLLLLLQRERASALRPPTL